MRPPHLWRASKTVTRLPARASSRAAIRPAAPAPTIRKCVRCESAMAGRQPVIASAAFDASRNLCALGCHSFLDSGACQHASAVLHYARHLDGVDPVAFNPGSDRKEVGIADCVLLAHHTWTLEELVFDQLKAFRHVRRHFA